MNITIVHLGGSEKVCTLEGFDPPRPWVHLRYPGGGGVWAFSLSHSGIESKRGTLPEWRLCASDLATLRAQAKELGCKFNPVPFARAKLLTEKQRPGSPRKRADLRTLELFK